MRSGKEGEVIIIVIIEGGGGKGFLFERPSEESSTTHAAHGDTSGMLKKIYLYLSRMIVVKAIYQDKIGKHVPHKPQGSSAKGPDFQRSIAKQDLLNNQEFLSLFAF
jgi:hypothetical protein